MDGEPGTMPEFTKPSLGSLVTFLLRDQTGERYRVGKVTGPIEPDPTTGEPWVGVRMAEGVRNLIPMTTVVHVRPPEQDAA